MLQLKGFSLENCCLGNWTVGSNPHPLRHTPKALPIITLRWTSSRAVSNILTSRRVIHAIEAHCRGSVFCWEYQ